MTTSHGWFVLERRVAWVDTDPSGAYQFTAAIRYVEDTEISMLRELGILDLLYPHLPRVAVQASYRRPCYFEEVVQVLIRVSRLGESSIEYEFRLQLPDGTRCAEGSMTAVFVGSSGQPTTLPEEARRTLDARFAVDPLVGERVDA
jgi:acyl-CoA thioesterase FadM